MKDRNRFLNIARGSALECAAIGDVLSATGGLDKDRQAELKRTLNRIVSMLTRLIARADAVSEPAVEYEHEYRDAEYEYDPKVEREPWDATKRRQRRFFTSTSSFAAR
ncbi:four helix bundle protein [Novipirellula galeiformis]|uniref:four helix bundle protein n=1 Tax=Novipirellula galeiformis TaxID=2528004 RepID=UPI001E6060EC|nr:four helix bundle protein [Novipirellula galeiformis]